MYIKSVTDMEVKPHHQYMVIIAITARTVTRFAAACVRSVLFLDLKVPSSE